jgi:uncharacterized SAM-binding protein YcdF (DUF218 family)
MLVSSEGKQNAQKNRRRVFVAFLLLGLWLIALLGARGLIVSEPLDRADAIVVLSGSSTLAERTQHAAQLYSEQRSSRILLTTDNEQGGWSNTEKRNLYFHEITVNELTRLGVPAQNIEVIRPPVSSTWDEAERVCEYSKAHGLRSMLIVTSGYHSRRALWTFRTICQNATQVGLDPVAPGIQTPHPATWWLYPRGWQLVFIEYLKLIYYLCRSL